MPAATPKQRWQGKARVAPESGTAVGRGLALGVAPHGRSPGASTRAGRSPPGRHGRGTRTSLATPANATSRPRTRRTLVLALVALLGVTGWTAAAAQTTTEASARGMMAFGVTDGGADAAVSVEVPVVVSGTAVGAGQPHVDAEPLVASVATTWVSRRSAAPGHHRCALWRPGGGRRHRDRDGDPCLGRRRARDTAAVAVRALPVVDPGEVAADDATDVGEAEAADPALAGTNTDQATRSVAADDEAFGLASPDDTPTKLHPLRLHTPVRRGRHRAVHTATATDNLGPVATLQAVRLLNPEPAPTNRPLAAGCRHGDDPSVGRQAPGGLSGGRVRRRR